MQEIVYPTFITGRVCSFRPCFNAPGLALLVAPCRQNAASYYRNMYDRSGRSRRMFATVSSSSELSIDGVWGCGEPREVVTGEACSVGNSSSAASEGLDNSVRAFRVERGRSLIGRTGLGAPSRKSTFPKAHELGLLWSLSGGLTLLGINSSDWAPSREDRARPVQLVLDDLE